MASLVMSSAGPTACPISLRSGCFSVGTEPRHCVRLLTDLRGIAALSLINSVSQSFEEYLKIECLIIKSKYHNR